MLKRFFVLLAFGLVAVFLSRIPWRTQGGRGKAVKLTRERRRRVMAELAALDQLKISPREEVIARYNFFLRFMELVQFPREDYLPAEDYNEQLKASYPPLAPHGDSLTGTFCDVLYGEADIQPARVAGFRKSLDSVLKHFGC
jgi:hypothetical protein